MSATEAALFGVLYLLLAAADWSLFCLGGSLGTFLLAVRHHRYGAAAKKALAARRTSESAEAPSDTTPGIMFLKTAATERGNASEKVRCPEVSSF